MTTYPCRPFCERNSLAGQMFVGGKQHLVNMDRFLCHAGSKKLKAVVNVMRNEQLQYLYHRTMMLLISKK